MSPPRTLVAGIGNLFLGDDGFGVEVVRRLATRPLASRVQVTDFGIRGMDLVFALQDDYDLVLLVDALPRGGRPGTLYVLEPQLDEIAPADLAALAGHQLDPWRALQVAAGMGARPGAVRIVGCEPGVIPRDADVQVGLSTDVEAAVDEAVALIESLLEPAIA